MNIYTGKIPDSDKKYKTILAQRCQFAQLSSKLSGHFPEENLVFYHIQTGVIGLFIPACPEINTKLTFIEAH